MQTSANHSPFNHCPKCSHGGLAPDSVKSFRCPTCDFVFYLNPAAAVAGLVVNADGDLLVVVRNHEPAKGTWDLPGGFLEPGETCEQGLRREIREELKRVFSDVIPVQDGGIDLEKAVDLARSLARPGDTVLLSPMTASFDMFKDYEHRGCVFKKIVKNLA